MFTVKPATLEEQYSILSEPRLLAILTGKPTLKELPAYLAKSEHAYKIITYKHHKLLFEVYPRPTLPVESGVYEFHIACPSTSIIASRVLGLAALAWVFKEYAPKVKMLVTDCPEGKIANFCRKLGGKEIYNKEGKLGFAMTAQSIHSLNN